MSAILIIAGGPSVATLDMNLASRFTTIAINNAWKIAPWAVECFAGDARWWLDEDKGGWGEGRKLVKGFRGLITSTDAIRGVIDAPNVKKLRLTADEKELDNAKAVLAPDSGTKAMCRAYHRGAEQILLAGYDSCADKETGQSHWHTEHKAITRPSQWAQFSSVHKRVAELLYDRGVEVFRVTKPGLKEIPYKPLEEFLCKYPASTLQKRSIVSSTERTYSPMSRPATTPMT